MKLTIAITKGEEFYIGTIKEMPGVITQGSTIEETKENLMDALQLYLEAMESESDLENVVLEEDLAINYVH
jgi:predicted RNase H-like HicB family nuclease